MGKAHWYSLLVDIAERPRPEGALIDKLGDSAVQLRHNAGVRRDGHGGLGDPHLPTHAKVNNECLRIVEDKPEELPAPTGPLDASAREPLS